MRIRVWQLALLSVLVLSLACAPPPAKVDTSADRAALEASAPAWAEAFNAGNAAGIAALYGPEAVLYPPNAGPVTGQAAIQEFWQGAIDTGVKVELEILATHVAGDHGHKVGKFRLMAGDAVADEGHYVELWERVEGQWLFQHDLWNSDLPLPDAAAAAE